MKTKNNTKYNGTKSWLFEKINKIDKLLPKLTKRKREKTQLNNIRHEKKGYHNTHQ
jgi:hypothetical protein